MDKQIHWRHRGMFEHYIDPFGFTKMRETRRSRCGVYMIENLVYVDELDKVTCKSCLKYRKVDLKLLDRIKSGRIYSGVIGGTIISAYGYGKSGYRDIFFIHSIKRVADNYYNYTIRYVYIKSWYKNRINNDKFTILTGNYALKEMNIWKVLECDEVKVKNLNRLVKLIRG